MSATRDQWPVESQTEALLPSKRCLSGSAFLYVLVAVSSLGGFLFGYVRASPPPPGALRLCADRPSPSQEMSLQSGGASIVKVCRASSESPPAAAATSHKAGNRSCFAVDSRYFPSAENLSPFIALACPPK